MQAGFFSTDITPPIGAVRAGNYSRIFIMGVTGAMKVRAAVFEQDGYRVGIAGVDCCSIDRSLIKKALDHVLELEKIQFNETIISASHTHTGAAASSFVDLDLVAKMDPKIAALTKDTAVPSEWYVDWVARQLATALIMASRRIEPARISTGIGEESGFTFNRRLFLKDGRAYSHPGKMNPDIVGPAGPTDPSVGVIGAWREDGTLLGCLVNFSCHGTTYGSAGTHADWYHFVEETIQRIFGSETGVVVLNGPCGDVTQVDNQSTSVDFGAAVCRRLGRRVGAEAVKVLCGSPRHAFTKLAGLTRSCLLPRRVPRPDSLPKAWEDVEAHRADPGHPDAVFGRERLYAAELARLQPQKPVILTAVQIGDAVLLSNPAEYFTSLSLRIKAESPFPNTLVVELANDCIGYVPDKAAFDPKTGGGYETVMTAYSNLIPEAGDIIADNLIAMSRSFTPEAAPEPPPFTPGKVWDYGRRGPDLD